MTYVKFPCGDKLEADPLETSELSEVHEALCPTCRQGEAENREADRRRQAEWEAHVDAVLAMVRK